MILYITKMNSHMKNNLKGHKTYTKNLLGILTTATEVC